MSPWKIIGWIILGLLLLSLAFCSYVCVRVADNYPTTSSGAAGAFSTTPAPAPSYQVSVISVICDSDYRDKARVTVRNTGMTEIPFAKLFVEFRDSAGKVVSADDSYFSPSTIPPGSTASAVVYSNGPPAHSCAPTQLQDRNGHQVTMIPAN